MTLALNGIGAIDLSRVKRRKLKRDENDFLGSIEIGLAREFLHA